MTDGDVTLPNEFETRSPAVLIANVWRTINADVQALEDRAIIVHFDPGTAEVHREAGQWCTDDVVYEFVGRHLHLVSHVSMRWYAKAANLREAGFVDWQESLLQMMCGNRTMSMVAAVVSDPRLNTENGRSWRTMLDGAHGTNLSTQVAGGFVGMVLGMYAYTEGPGADAAR